MNAPDQSPAIAIIGMSCRFPDAPDTETFWRNLASGLESLVHFSDTEMLEAGVPAALLDNPNYVKAGTPLENAEWFDAGFFGMSAREAEILDPQHRVFLECAWEALEDAGYGGDGRPERTGVYAGSTMGSYLFNNLLANHDFLDAVSGYPAILSTDKDFLATRASYRLNLKGPSLNIQTACSTSLVAVQTACQGLLSGQCDLALAGGVSIIFPQRSGYLYSEGMIFSPDGHCRPFDEKAKGIRCGAGAGIVVLKRLEDALRDTDAIQAVILGAAINNDGASKMGYTAPSVEGQAEVIASALRMARVSAGTIHYIETHGTGTEVGDPIEIAALEKVFQAAANGRQFCALGAVKSNIGHLDAAAGVAGLIKTTLVLRNKKIPPTLNYDAPNPRIDFAHSPFYVNTVLADWPSNGSARRAGLSSFGIGGTNAHAVLEEAPERDPSEVRWPQQLLVLSARTRSALEKMRTKLATHLAAHPEVSLADACWTLQVGRLRMAHRFALPCATREEAMESLRRPMLGKPASLGETAARPVAFLLSGQGSQYSGMASELYALEPVFRREFDRCADLLAADSGCDLRAPGLPINGTDMAQPALFALEYALGRMWIEWGVRPEAMIGHSVGEYTAACLAGVFSLEDALKIVAARGRIMQRMPEGAMLAAALAPEGAACFVSPGVALAAINSPTQCTLSGPVAKIQEIETLLQTRGVACRRLNVSHAFHSAMMDEALESFRRCFDGVRLSAPQIPFVSNLTGAWIKPGEATDPGYWVRHMRETVRFADGIREIGRAGGHVLLEIGPGGALSALARECLRESDRLVISSLPGRNDAAPDTETVIHAAGALWAAGVPLNWREFHRGEKLHRVSLPTYFFERQRYWVEPRRSLPVRPSNGPERKDLNDWFYAPSWKRSVLPASDRLPAGSGPWLIFGDCALARTLGEALSEAGEHFVTVRSGLRFESPAQGEYTIRPNSAEDYVRLWKSLNGSSFAPRTIVWLWALSEDENGRAQFDRLILNAQAIGDVPVDDPVEWLIATSHLCAALGDEQIDPRSALALGPAQVIPQEYPNISCRVIDIGSPETEAARGAIARCLLREPAMPPTPGPVAYRGSQRWEQIFDSVRLAEPEDRIRDAGVYVITGGFGGIGLTLARYIASRGRGMKLALIGRTGLPAREEWPQWLKAGDEGDPVRRRILETMRLEDDGAEVLSLQADVCDATATAAAIAQVRTRFGAIHGVIHAAGVVEGGLIQLKTREAAARVLAPKTEGTRILHALVKDSNLDFLVLCSSVSAIYPAAGEVDYASANAFLDAFADAEASQGLPVISINWWRWQDVGMAEQAVLPGALAEQKRAYLSSAIRPAEGVEAFRRALAARLPRIVVAPQSLDSIQCGMEDPGSGRLTPPATQTPSMSPHHARPELSTPFAPPGTEIEKKMTGIWVDLLGLSQIGIDDDFFELGGHSLMATGILARVRATFGVSMTLRAVFEAPTIRRLSERMDMLLWAASTPADADLAHEREEVEL